MKASLILTAIFSMSLLLSLVWSYTIIKMNSFDNILLGEKPTLRIFFRRIKLALFNFALMSIVSIIPVAVVGDSIFTFTFPGYIELISGFILILFIDDIWFYLIHRIMHSNKWLYKNIHIVHHKAMPPIPLDYLFAHPLEAIGATFGIFLGFIVTVLCFGNAYFYLIIVYSLYRTFHELCIHSGQRLLPKKWLGIIGSSKHHYLHHRHLNGNYASGFTILDRIFGTELEERKKV